MHITIDATTVQQVNPDPFPPLFFSRWSSSVVPGCPGCGEIHCGLQTHGKLQVHQHPRRCRSCFHLDHGFRLRRPTAVRMVQVCDITCVKMEERADDIEELFPFIEAIFFSIKYQHNGCWYPDQWLTSQNNKSPPGTSQRACSAPVDQTTTPWLKATTTSHTSSTCLLSTSSFQSSSSASPTEALCWPSKL